MALVLRAAPNVGLGLSRLRRQPRGLIDRAVVQRLTRQRLLGRGALNVVRPDTGECDACPVDRAAGHLEIDGHPDGREVPYPPLELEVGPSTRASRGWHPSPHRNLTLVQGVLERPDHELRNRDGTLTAVSVAGDDLATQRQHHRCPVTLRVCVAKGADKSSTVAHHGVGDQRRSGEHDGKFAPQQ